MKLVPAIIIAVALLLAPVLWIVLPKLFEGGKTTTLGPDATVEDLVFEFLNMESQIYELQETIQELNATVLNLGSRVEALEREIVALRGFPGTGGVTGDHLQGQGTIPDNEYTEVVLIQNRTGFNDPLTVASSSFIVELLGKPREVLSDNCEPMTNDALKGMLRTEQVGPVRVSMLQPAIESLQRVFDTIKRADPKLHDLINTAGALCVRQIRGTTGRYSNHSFGLAVDLNINGILDNFTDGKTQLGLIIIADFFHEEGWIWGAGFRREDSMHFEVSKEKLLEWRSAGLI